MKIFGWLLMIGGAGYFILRKLQSTPVTSSDPVTAAPTSNSYVFEGQVGSNFYDLSSQVTATHGSTASSSPPSSSPPNWVFVNRAFSGDYWYDANLGPDSRKYYGSTHP